MIGAAKATATSSRSGYAWPPHASSQGTCGSPSLANSACCRAFSRLPTGLESSESFVLALSRSNAGIRSERTADSHLHLRRQGRKWKPRTPLGVALHGRADMWERASGVEEKRRVSKSEADTNIGTRHEKPIDKVVDRMAVGFNPNHASTTILAAATIFPVSTITFPLCNVAHRSGNCEV